MTANLLLHNYYYRYRQKRQLVKALVESLNYTQAKTDLEASILEQETFYPNMEITRDFNFGENIMQKHALAHLNTVIDDNDPPYLDRSTQETKHQSDIVKDTLDRIPKQDYS